MSRKSRIAANRGPTANMSDVNIRNIRGAEPIDLVNRLLTRSSLNREQRRVLKKYERLCYETETRVEGATDA